MLARNDFHGLSRAAGPNRQMCLFADRLSTDEMKANQLRLYFSSLVLHTGSSPAPLGVERAPSGPRPKSTPFA